MIVAITKSEVPVEVERAACWDAQIRSLGRENLNQSYVGGEGYKGTKFANVDRAELEFVATLEPETCEPLQNWLEAMEATDLMADNDWPDVSAALAQEEGARRAFIEYVHKNSIRRSENKNEISPEYARNPAINHVEVRIEELSNSQRMALCREGGQG